MIGSFRNADLEEFCYEGPGGRAKRIPAAIHRALCRKLDLLFNAADLRDLRAPPGNRLEALKGDRKGLHSIRVSDQWRLVFRWEGDTAYDVELTDYR